MVKNVQWYPGHMEKARRQMVDSINAVDFVIEVRDARIPRSSANPLLEQMAKDKPRLVLLNKADLADAAATAEWIQALTGEHAEAFATNLASDSTIRNKIVSASDRLCREKKERMIKRGIHPRAMRAMVCGVPNVGKSTLINRIAGKKSAKSEDRPGVTRSLTWIHAASTLDVLDTPGVLWPKFADQRTGSLLAATGAINEDILDLADIAMDTIHVIRARYPGVLEKEYDCDPSIRTDRMLEQIAEKRHLLKEDGKPDTRRAAISFLHEFRRGKLGLFTLEGSEDDKAH